MHDLGVAKWIFHVPDAWTDKWKFDRICYEIANFLIKTDHWTDVRFSHAWGPAKTGAGWKDRSVWWHFNIICLFKLVSCFNTGNYSFKRMPVNIFKKRIIYWILDDFHTFCVDRYKGTVVSKRTTEQVGATSSFALHLSLVTCAGAQ